MSTIMRAFIIGEKEKSIPVGLCMSNMWQILKRLIGTFHQAQTLIFES